MANFGVPTLSDLVFAKMQRSTASSLDNQSQYRYIMIRVPHWNAANAVSTA